MALELQFLLSFYQAKLFSRAVNSILQCFRPFFFKLNDFFGNLVHFVTVLLSSFARLYRLPLFGHSNIFPFRFAFLEDVLINILYISCSFCFLVISFLFFGEQSADYKRVVNILPNFCCLYILHHQLACYRFIVVGGGFCFVFYGGGVIFDQSCLSFDHPFGHICLF